MKVFNLHSFASLLKVPNSGRYTNTILKKYSTACENADLLIIGIGPAGMAAAARAAENGMENVIIVDPLPLIGGTCINYGCVPSKNLLKSSLKYHLVKSGCYCRQGITTGDVSLDVGKLMESKLKVQQGISSVMENLFKSKGFKILKGKASFKDYHQIAVKTEEGQEILVDAYNIIIATGSASQQFPNIKVDETQIVTSIGALSLKTVPKRFVVLGGGIVAIEMGCVWHRLGSEVTIALSGETIIGPVVDNDILKELRKLLEKQGIKFIFNHKILGVEKDNNIVKVQLESEKDGKKTELESEVVMVALGREPYTKGLGLDGLEIETDKKGAIPVNDCFQTCIPNIYAVGDVVPGPMTAHKAAEDGASCVDGLCDKHYKVDWNHMPLVVYTHPEVAAIGKTEDDLKKKGIPYKVQWSELKMCQKAQIDQQLRGVMKAMICPNTDEILGTHVLCPLAGEFINGVNLARQYGLSASKVSQVAYVHPTYAEMMKFLYMS